jgi:hypothetical protein
MQDTVLKEAFDLLEAMRRQLTDVIVVTVFRIISTNSYDLVILFTLITAKRNPQLKKYCSFP